MVFPQGFVAATVLQTAWLAMRRITQLAVHLLPRWAIYSPFP
jgi:hypothetical protein